jgi:UPF0288 family protein (methanogenesis marker protein 3)
VRTETRFLINEGETRTLFRERGLEVVGIEEELVCNRERGAITDNNSGGGRVWRQRRDVTEALGHVRRGVGVEEPVVGGLRLVQRDVVEGGEQLWIQLGESADDVSLGCRG